MRTSALIVIAALGLSLATSTALGQPPKSVPYVWQHVKIVAGGFVPGIEFSSAKKNLIYLRTDMGGAYRWDQANNRWVCISDWISRSDWNRMGFESIAPDPSDGKRVYGASGTYMHDWADDGVVLRSANQGRTWAHTQMPFRMGGNEDGRSIGERMAVDPHLNKIVYLGSRDDGLWKSSDFGATWSKVTSFPFAGKPGGMGVGFVVFDPQSGKAGTATRVIYVGVEDGETHLYRSNDAGTSWSAIAGEPAGLIPHHAVLTPQGLIYSTWCNGPGPNGVSDGAVYVYNTRTGQWTDISPIKPNSGSEPGFGFAGLSVDAEHPQTVMVATLDRWGPGDDIFRSTDGGKTWKSLKKYSVRDVSLSPYLYWGKKTVPVGHWIGALEIDPFDSNHVLYATGATIFGTHDITAMDHDQITHWKVAGDGVEQTAVLDLISPPVGPHLLSGLGDLGGFRHDDLNVSPAEGMFKPIFISCSCLDYAQNDPSFIVRVGASPHGHGAYSTDIGKTWTLFASEPAGADSGTIAVSADAKTLVWAPRRSPVSYSTDRGASWHECTGVKAGDTVIADRVDPNEFYAISDNGGALKISSDGGKNFSSGAGDLPRPESRIRAWPGRAGTILLPSHAGLFQSTDSGKSFTKISSVGQADAVGFGKAAPGSTDLTLYLSGQIAGVDGVFRSTDGGKTWVRINDNNHRYGIITPVIGDPRIFSRVYLGTNGRGIVYGDSK